MGRWWFKLNVFAFGRGPLASYLYVQRKIELNLAPTVSGNTPGQVSWRGWGLQPAASLHRLQTKGEGMWLVQSWLALLSSLPAQSKGAYGHYWGVSGKSDALICWVFPTVKISLSSFIGDAWLPHLTEQMLYLL